MREPRNNGRRANRRAGTPTVQSTAMSRSSITHSARAWASARGRWRDAEHFLNIRRVVGRPRMLTDKARLVAAGETMRGSVLLGCTVVEAHCSGATSASARVHTCHERPALRFARRPMLFGFWIGGRRRNNGYPASRRSRHRRAISRVVAPARVAGCSRLLRQRMRRVLPRVRRPGCRRSPYVAERNFQCRTTERR